MEKRYEQESNGIGEIFYDRGPKPQLQPQISPRRNLRLSVRALAFRRASKNFSGSVRRNTARGFTLVETLMTILIYGFVMAGCGALLIAIFTNSNAQPLALNEVDQAHAVSTEFVNELRDAAYGNDGSFPIGEASSTEIIFFSPFDSGSSTTVDRIRYFVASSTLYKGIIVPSGSPLSYSTANEKVTTVLSNVSLASSSAFFYYNGSYAGTSSPLSQPVNVNQITYVQLELNVLMKQLRNATSTFEISTGAAVRNLKVNLGN